MSRGDLPQSQIVWQGKAIVRVLGEVAAKANRAVQPLELLNALLNLRSEVTHETLYRPGSGIAQSADRSAFDLFPVQISVLDSRHCGLKRCNVRQLE